MSDDFISRGHALAREALDRGSKNAALGRLSIAFERNRDPAYLVACVVCIDRAAGSIDFDQAGLMSVDYALFTRCGHLAPEETRRLRTEVLAPAYFQLITRLRDHFENALTPRTIDLSKSATRVLLVTPQILGAKHAPSLRLSEIARQIILRGDHEVRLVNPNAWPLRSASTFYPPWHANKMNHDGLGRLAYEDVHIPFFSAGGPADVVGRLERVVDFATEFEPHIVINQGDLNPAGELLSYAYPTLFLPTTTREPVTRAHTLVDFADNFADLTLDHAALHGFTPDVRRFRLDLGIRPDKTAPQTRAMHGLPEDAFLVAVVGNRLSQELTPAFCDMLGGVLDQAPGAHLVFVGGRTKLHGALQSKRDRITELAFNEDISSFLELCDCYVNPPRVGAGRTAYLAAMELVPVLCLPDGDAAMAIGAEHALPDLAAFSDALVAMATDEGARQAWRATAEAVRAGIKSRPSGIDDLIASFAATRAAFLAAAAPEAAVAVR